MKELSIEEKAKRYDEAIEKAKIWQEHLYDVNDKDYADELNYIFPELKESEDENIRKALIQLVNKSHEQGGYALHKDEAEEMIAYLEKQGEHANFRNKIQIGDKVTRNKDGVLVNLSQLNRVAKKDEKQGEQKPNYNNKELKDVVIAELSKYNSNDLNAPWATDSTGLQYPLYFANLGAKWQKEQKPAWSEGDKKMFDAIMCSLDKDKLQRVWNLNEDDVENWLKSLRPQPQWKPSGFHLECIEDAISLYEKHGINAIGLKEILDELKKLRKE